MLKIPLGTYFVSIETNEFEGSEYDITVEKVFVPELNETSEGVTVNIMDTDYIQIQENIPTLGTKFPWNFT
jgi:hypothetical protein